MAHTASSGSFPSRYHAIIHKLRIQLLFWCPAKDDRDNGGNDYENDAGDDGGGDGDDDVDYDDNNNDNDEHDNGWMVLVGGADDVWLRTQWVLYVLGVGF